MTLEMFLKTAIIPALSFLPPKMDSNEARAMLLAIALQESQCCERRQIKGPALGYYQFELNGVIGVLNHPISSSHVVEMCQLFDITCDPTSIYRAIQYHDILASALARLLLRTSPRPLPLMTEGEKGWEEYVQLWRPGKPKYSTWHDNFTKAWRIVILNEDEENWWDDEE